MRLYLLVMGLFLLCGPVTAQPQPSGTRAPIFGVVGDSNSDEYRADDARGAPPWTEHTLNWVELLVKYRGVDFGPWGTWGEPRRTGFKYNWARSGGTSRTIHTDKQVSGLAAQIAGGEVTHALIWVGVNDFRPGNEDGYDGIYYGTLSGSALQNKLDQVVEYVAEATDILLDAGAEKVVLMGIDYLPITPNGRVLPVLEQVYPDPSRRQRVVEALKVVNAGYEAIASSRPNAIYVEPAYVVLNPLDRSDAQGNLQFGGTTIDPFTYSDEPLHLQLTDAHYSTILNGFVAEHFFVKPMNAAGVGSYANFTEEEMVARALGRSYTPQDPGPDPEGTQGDADGNGSVNRSDVDHILRHSTGRNNLSGADAARAEVSGNGNVSAWDASLVYQYVEGGLSCFYADDDCGESPPVNTGPSNVTVRAGTRTVSQNQSFAVPVTIGDLTNTQTSSFRLALSYDADLLTATGVSTQGGVDENLAVDFYVPQPGQLVVAAAADGPIPGSGTLISLTFDSKTTSGSGSLDLTAATFNEGNLTANLEDGLVEVGGDGPVGMLGDVTGNGEVTSLDASRILQHMIGAEPLDDGVLAVADVTGNDSISALDASIILHYVAELIDCFPAAPGCPLVVQGSLSSTDVMISWGAAHVEGTSLSVPVLLDPGSDRVAAIHLMLEPTDAGTWVFDQVESTLPEDWILAYSERADRRLQVVMAGVTPLQSASLVTLRLHSTTPGSCCLAGRAVVNDGATKTLGVLEAPGASEASYLLVNYPNPFSGQTAIRYTLPEPTDVRLTVYDVLGREVTTLIDAPQAEGDHEVPFNAGTLPAGVYFYRLETATARVTRSMLNVPR